MRQGLRATASRLSAAFGHLALHSSTLPLLKLFISFSLFLEKRTAVPKIVTLLWSCRGAVAANVAAAAPAAAAAASANIAAAASAACCEGANLMFANLAELAVTFGVH